MSMWYFAKNGNKIGPLSHGDALEFALKNPDALAWRDGMADWVQVKRIDELTKSSKRIPEVRNPSLCDEIDYKIFGNDMQFVEIELDPEETAIAEAGSMMYKDDTIEMQALLGDGSKGGIMGKFLAAGKRIMTGESMFITAFTHKGYGKSHIAFSAPYPGHIIPVALPAVGGTIICQKDSFLCAARGVSISVFFQRRILTGLFGGEGFVMQKLEGDGMVFIHAGGTISEMELAEGQGIHVDTGCVVAFEPTVDFDVAVAGGIKSQLFGGEGVFVSHLKGPGKVWIQSLPFSRFAGRMLASVYRNVGQGSGRPRR